MEAEKASVAVIFPDGEVTAVTVTNLGGPSELGTMLQEHYLDRMKILGLIGLGNLLSVGRELGTAQSLERMDSRLENRNFQELVTRQCVAVARDRNGDQEKGQTQEYSGLYQWASENAGRHRYAYDGSRGGTGIWLYGAPAEGIPLPMKPLERLLQAQRNRAKLRGGRPIRHPGPRT